MNRNNALQIIGKAGALVAEGIGSVGSAAGTMLDNLRAEEQRRANALALQRANEIKYWNAMCVQHDLGISMMGMNPPTGLTAIHDPNNLTYLSNYCLNDKTFAFYWQKSIHRYPLRKPDLLATRNLLNNRIKMLAYQLKMAGYTAEYAATEYPAIYNGFGVVDVHNSDDGVILIARIR